MVLDFIFLFHKEEPLEIDKMASKSNTVGLVFFFSYCEVEGSQGEFSLL